MTIEQQRIMNHFYQKQDKGKKEYFKLQKDVKKLKEEYLIKLNKLKKLKEEVNQNIRIYNLIKNSYEIHNGTNS